ncbi:response regulator [Aliikangiella sp. IMCC44653]
MTHHALIVDDSRLACKVMGNMLDSFGISSMAVYSAEQALEFLKHNKTDIIFLDHNMPGMDGLETIQVIKSNPLTATIPVMMYTAKSGGVYVSQARALGAVDVLPKGIEKEFLENALAKLGLIQSAPKAEAKPPPHAKPASVNDEPHSAENITPTATPASLSQAAVNGQPQEAKTATNLSHVIAQAWNAMWAERAQPFISQQRNLHNEELAHITKKQNRYLTREIHQTLENFEHALAIRMESQHDYQQAKSELVINTMSRWIKICVFSTLALALLFIWAMFQLHQSQNQLTASENRLALWKSQLDLKLDRINNKVEHLSVAPAVALSNAPSENIWFVENENNQVIAEITSPSSQSGEYSATSLRGYHFIIDHKGGLGFQVVEAFYLTNNCIGDTFIKATPGQIFNLNEQLYFVDKNAEPMQVNINSMQTEQGCEKMDGELLNLFQLQVNNSFETGIDSAVQYHITQ